MKSGFSRALFVIALIVEAGIPTGFTQDLAAQESVAKSSTEFALDLYRQFASRGGNQTLYFSPYSIYTVLALMHGGAAGETAEQMATALHVDVETEDSQTGLANIQSILNQISQRGAVQLNIANSLWPQSGAVLNPEFLKLAGRYRAELYQVD